MTSAIFRGYTTMAQISTQYMHSLR